MSSNKLAIRVANVSKQYALFRSPVDRLRQSLRVRTRQALGLPLEKREGVFSALSNISFEVPRGHTVGIVGRNGSGKSTLLQLVCGTLTPTAGEIEVSGRVAALLELGAGFNPDYSGRDNVFLNAAILGMSKKETEDKLDDILSFADIGQFIDQPVKSYSSGMYVRLAFATAINTDPDVLIIDEALAVGDEAFQRKCFARIRQIQSSGSTVLFVSHSAQSVIELCDHAVLLEQGELLMQGDPKAVTSQYQKLVHAPAEKVDAIRSRMRLDCRTNGVAVEAPAAESEDDATAQVEQSAEPKRPGLEFEAFDPNFISQSRVDYVPQGASIHDARIINSRDKKVNIIVHGETYNCCFSVRFERAFKGVKFAMALKTVSGFEIFSQWSDKLGEGFDVKDGDNVCVRMPFDNTLLPGSYFLNAGVFVEESGNFIQIHRIVDVIALRVAPYEFSTQRHGVVNMFNIKTKNDINIEVM